MREKYHLKEDKKAFFYPRQWLLFYNSLKDKSKPYFMIAINTGGRINEIRNLKVRDIDFNNKTLKFRVTKIKAKKGQTRPEPRIIKISTEFSNWLKRWIKACKLKDDDTFNIPSTAAINKLIVTKLKKLDIIRDFKNTDFSSHNIRKTHGTWLNAIGVPALEIALRMGHDIETLRSSYASPSLFDETDLQEIKNILGDLYINLRK